MEATNSSMENVFHPGVRKWISPLFKIEEEVKSLREIEDKFKEPLLCLPGPDRVRELQRADELSKAAEEKKVVKLKLFGPKKRGRPRKKSVPDDIDEMETEGFDSADESDLDDGFDTYSDEDEKSLNEFEKAVKNKKLQADEDLYMFASSSDDDNGDSKWDEIPFPVLDDAGPKAGPSSSKTNIKENKKAESGSSSTPSKQGKGNPNPIAPTNAGAEKDEKDFKLFYEYVSRHADRVQRRKIEEDRDDMTFLIMKEQGVSREQAEIRFKQMAEDTNPHLGMCRSEVIMEDPLIKGSEMPLLAGPIPNEALQSSGSLALYAGLSDEPGNFQWRMGHVVDILTSQVKGNLKLLRKEHLEPAKDKERVFLPNEAICTISVYQPWDEADDILNELKTIPEPEFGMEIEILSSQTVGDLSEMFRCQADLVCTKDFKLPDLPASASAALAATEKYLAKTVTPWRAIFIHDTIYLNFDESDVVNYEGVQKLLDWVERHREDSGIGAIKVSNKMDTKLSELQIQLGYPYLFAHQSINCEHLFCFNAIRLPRNVEFSIFPRFTRIGKFPTKYCVCDNELLARWAVVGCRRLPQDPMLLCTDCVQAYCYSRKNKKKRIGTFKLYPLFQLVHHIQ